MTHVHYHSNDQIECAVAIINVAIRCTLLLWTFAPKQHSGKQLPDFVRQTSSHSYPPNCRELSAFSISIQ